MAKPSRQRVQRRGRRRCGRPRKFEEPSKAITVTLPVRTLRRLSSLDTDRAKALAFAVDQMLDTGRGGTQTARMIRVGPGTALIVVGPSHYLERIPGLRMVEVARNRYLVSVPLGTSPEALELELLDLIEKVPPEEVSEREQVTTLIRILGSAHRDNRMTREEILLVHF